MGGRTTPSDFSLNVPLSSGQKLPSAPPALASNSTLDVRVVPSKFFDAARPFLLNGTLYNDKQLGDLLDMPHTSASQFLVHHKDYTSSCMRIPSSYLPFALLLFSICAFVLLFMRFLYEYTVLLCIRTSRHEASTSLVWIAPG